MAIYNDRRENELPEELMTSAELPEETPGEDLRANLMNGERPEAPAKTLGDEAFELAAEEEREQFRTEKKITKESIARADATLQKYRSGKNALETRIVENERWYKLRHWENLRKSGNTGDPEPVSAWLLNSIANKHADAMDNYPMPTILPREESDMQTAEILSDVLPVVLDNNGFEEAYSAMWWKKLKTGTGVFGVFWDSTKEGGLGDITIKDVDLLNIYWEPGIKDIQESRHLFVTEIVDNEQLEDEYGDLVKGRLGGGAITVGEYVHDESIDTSDKSVVVDWYYKKNGVLHYVKYVNDVILYASEDDDTLDGHGFYDHGMYPLVFDVQFVEEDSPAGFGYIDVCKSPQAQIDRLNSLILKKSIMAARPRFFVRNGAGVNEEEYASIETDFVHIQGASDPAQAVKEIVVTPVDGNTMTFLTQKVDELKETSGNRDFSQGGTTNGVTAASAIAALQEAGNKLSRDMIKSSYRAMSKVFELVLELMRQFYDEPRYFRITQANGKPSFVSFDNAGMKAQPIENDFGLVFGERKPQYDIKVKAQKANTFSTLAQNEMAKEFYSAGFFNPQLADQSLACIEMMDFEGKDAIIEKISRNGTMYQQMQQMGAQIQQLQAMLGMQQQTAAMAAQAQAEAPEQTANIGKAVETDSLGNEKPREASNVTKARERAAGGVA